MKVKLDETIPLGYGITPPSTRLTFKDVACRCGKLDSNNPETYERCALNLGELDKEGNSLFIKCFRCSNCKEIVLMESCHKVIQELGLEEEDNT